MVAVRECLLAEFTCKRYDRTSSIFAGRYENKYFFVSFEDLVEGEPESEYEVGADDDILLYRKRLRSSRDTADAITAYWGIDESYSDPNKGAIQYDKCVAYVENLIKTLRADSTPPKLDLGDFRGDLG